MKKLYFLLLISYISFTAQATVWTVSNNPNSPGQFSDLQTAIDTSIVNNGDTLYISGSLTSYGNITLNKPLTLIGTGHHPNKDFPLVSKTGSITLDEKTDAYGTVLNSADGSKIIGLQTGRLQDYYGASNIKVSKCYIRPEYGGAISASTSSNNWIISNNFITCTHYNSSTIYLGGTSNVLVNNNVINADAGNNLLAGYNNTNIIISHNLFIQSTSFATFSISNAIISNNIFYGVQPTGASSCTFNNNIATSYDLPYDDNTGSNNINVQAPGFVNVPAADYVFNWGYDYRLTASSPGHNAGTDGTDIGPFGGSDPLSTTGEPAIPVIMQMNILNPTLPENGTIEIQLKARVQE
ncbi:MAG: hypothetical protein P1P88_18300 [Bacteroidales bacterium]|nr:hypothetical protein [Bacteroidales bacterium]